MTSNFDGVSSERTEIQNAHVRDGATNTLLIAEKYLNPNYYFTGNSCVDNNTTFQGNDWDTNRWVVQLDASGNATGSIDRRLPMQDTPGFENCTDRFGSAHSSGFHAVMCDGSVHRFAYSIDPAVWGRLGHRSDGADTDAAFN
jgi:hypothetical protein